MVPDDDEIQEMGQDVITIAKALGTEHEGVIVTHVVPHFSTNLPVVREFQIDLREMEHSANPNLGSLEGYIAVRILELALNSLEQPPDQENLVDALEKLNTFDIGWGFPLTLSASQHQTSHAI